MAVPIPADQVPLEMDSKKPNFGRWKIYWSDFFNKLGAGPPLTSYTVTGLPSNAIAGQAAYASNGRKPGEGAGGGTGVLVYYDSTGHWISVHSAVAVTS